MLLLLGIFVLIEGLIMLMEPSGIIAFFLQ